MGVVMAVDIGGTFTDLVLFDPRLMSMQFVKRPTTYDDFGKAIVQCIEAIDVEMGDVLHVKHGTTLVINALLQRRGAKLALVTTAGFRDVLEIGRGNRMKPFDLRFRRDPPLISREFRFEVDERMSASGEVLHALDMGQLEDIADRLQAHDIDAVAISFLHAYKNPAHEQAARDFLSARLPGCYICAGSDLSREWHEYERTATAAANAFVGPAVTGYVRRLDKTLADHDFEGSLILMGSHGGVISQERACAEPIALVESGPVGGCIGAAAFGRRLGLESLICFDMGGTTAKCALIHDGEYDVETTYYVGGEATGFPIRGNVVDILEVGVGGGSIAFLGDDGRLNVGPKSAGSSPGPICYDRGGTEPSVTDANLVLSRINPAGFLNGDMPLNLRRAREGVNETFGGYFTEGPDDIHTIAAAGILELANLTMATAIKQISIARGHDPRDFALFCIGGGGPLHGVDLARELHIPKVIIPPEPGNFSAIGMLMADAKIVSSRTDVMVLDDAALPRIHALFCELEDKTRASLQTEFGGQECLLERQLEVRYQGQKHVMKIALQPDDTSKMLFARFETAYRRRYGHNHQNSKIEAVSLISTGWSEIKKPQLETLVAEPVEVQKALRRSVYSLSARQHVDAAVYDRYALPVGFSASGPALIEEYGSTTFVGERDTFQIGHFGEIEIECHL